METLDLADLTRFLGQPDHEQQAVLAWTGENVDKTWTPGEAAELKVIWDADTARIEADYPDDDN